MYGQNTGCEVLGGKDPYLRRNEERPDQERGHGRSKDTAFRWYRGKGRRERSFKKELVNMLKVSR